MPPGQHGGRKIKVKETSVAELRILSRNTKALNFNRVLLQNKEPCWAIRLKNI